MFSKNPIIIYLGQKLSVYGLTKVQELDLSANSLVVYGEVIDKNAFKKALNDFFKNLNLQKADGILVIGSQFVFSEKVKTEKEIEEFVRRIPIAWEKVAVIEKKEKEFSNVFAINKDLYKLLLTSAQENGLNIAAVLPQNAYSKIAGKTEFNESDLEVINNKNIINEYNFLTQTKAIKILGDQAGSLTGEVSQYESKTNKNLKNQIILLIVLVIILVGSIIYAYIYYQSNSHPKLRVSPIIKSIPAISKSVPPTITLVNDKSLVHIKVLNGSGIAGQAGLIKDQLSGIGFTDIETGNADATTESSLVYSKNISKSLIDDLLSLIKNQLTNLRENISSDSASAITIILGG